MDDVYFRDDFAKLHAVEETIDELSLNGFRHLAKVQKIPGTRFEDLSTPWGYGGPAANDIDALRDGLVKWRQRQASAGRVAEFFRFHPFLNAEICQTFLDRLELDRMTVLLDLHQSQEQRWKHYTKGTRYSVRKAQGSLAFDLATKANADICHQLYVSGLDRNNASDRYYLTVQSFVGLLSMDWADIWLAGASDTPIAFACFLKSGPFVHYHLSGGSDEARDTFAHYGLLENAISHYSGMGQYKWLHLGGGRTNAKDDALLKFKTRFSGNTVPSYVGGIIHDREAYNGLAVEGSRRFLSYRNN